MFAFDKAKFKKSVRQKIEERRRDLFENSHQEAIRAFKESKNVSLRK